jgi:hypothetical protein
MSLYKYNPVFMFCQYLPTNFNAQFRLTFRLFTTFCQPGQGLCAAKDQGWQNVAEFWRGNEA